MKTVKVTQAMIERVAEMASNQDDAAKLAYAMLLASQIMPESIPLNTEIEVGEISGEPQVSSDTTFELSCGRKTIGGVLVNLKATLPWGEIPFVVEDVLDFLSELPDGAPAANQTYAPAPVMVDGRDINEISGPQDKAGYRPGEEYQFDFAAISVEHDSLSGNKVYKLFQEADHEWPIAMVDTGNKFGENFKQTLENIIIETQSGPKYLAELGGVSTARVVGKLSGVLKIAERKTKGGYYYKNVKNLTYSNETA